MSIWSKRRFTIIESLHIPVIIYLGTIPLISVIIIVAALVDSGIQTKKSFVFVIIAITLYVAYLILFALDVSWIVRMSSDSSTLRSPITRTSRERNRSVSL